MCRDRKIFFVVEGRRPDCWWCGPAGHVAKVCPTRKPMPESTTTAEVVVANDKPAESTDGPGEWREVVKKESKIVGPSPSPQKDVPGKKERTQKQLEECKTQQQQ